MDGGSDGNISSGESSVKEWNGMGRGAELRSNQLDAIAVTAEVSGVEWEEFAFAMGEHGGDDVGVVNLAFKYGDFAAQDEQRFSNLGASTS